MTSVFNRRAALNFAGAGSAAALLSACAPIRTVVKHQEAESSSASSSASAGPASSSSSAASNSPSSSSSVDHKGEVKLESYDTSAGTYRPATRTQPPKNVPKPVKPDNIREESAAGLYSSLAFMIASLQYLFATGDDQYLEQSDLNDEDKRDITKDSARDMYKAFKEGEAWLDNPTFTAVLEEPQPTKHDDTYHWPATFTSDLGEYIAAPGKVQEFKETERKHTYKGELTAKYSDGAWHLSDFNSQSPGASASASPSSSI